ncbi:hypothetical protein FS837_008552 [Tulasnella sp. UAMH 9824]|nr:hypothetical protein FS837_008552 [Tulasnella sp. UAMH 9824]
MFIRSLRAAAWKEDKVEDDRWIANYASLHFSGKALRWHSQLPPDVRRDWAKLEMALLDQWPSPDVADSEDSMQVPIVPTPAAAPHKSNSIATNQASNQGVIKVVSFDSGKVFYLAQLDSGGKCGLTKEIGSALHVSMDLNTNPHILELSPTHGKPRYRSSWVGIHWLVAEPEIRTGSQHWGRIALVDSITMKSSWTQGPHGARITTWDIAMGGDLRPAWFEDDQETLLDVFIAESGLEITIVADPGGYAARYTGESRARLVLQPLT